MIISPTLPPAAAIEQSSVNQSLLNQIDSSQQSRRATDTVQLSSEARNLASTKLDNNNNANNAQLAAKNPNDNELQEAVPDNEAAEPPRPNSTANATNNVAQQQQTAKIDIIA